MNPLDDFAAIISIDWADRKHDLCLKSLDSEALEFSVLEHKSEAIEDWATVVIGRKWLKPRQCFRRGWGSAIGQLRAG